MPPTPNHRKLSRQLVIFLFVLTLTLLACQAVTGIPNTPVPESPSATQAPADTATDTPVNPEPEQNPDQVEECLPGEIYHAEEDLCYTEDGSAIQPFLDMMTQQTTAEIPADDDEGLDDEYTLVTYQINGSQITDPSFGSVSDDLRAYQQDEQSQQRVWAYFAAIIPPDRRDELVQFVVITDGPGGSLAAVEQSPDDPYAWRLNIDIADTSDIPELTFTLIHEYGHLLTLNASQVSPNLEIFQNPDNMDLYDQAEAACPTYFPGEGCAADSAYLYQFFNQFWAGMYDEWLNINTIEDDDEYYTALDDFYYAREDEFVTDYAVTNPEEDIAESWSYFILKPKPAGNTIAEQKVLFFYQFPELVQLREEIIARTYSRLIRMQP